MPLKRVAIVQARTNSTRLPGKVLQDLAGRPLLAQMLRRLKRCRNLDEIVVATTRDAADRPVVELAERHGARWFCGDEHDVLGRFVGAAKETAADVVVRCTGDCPLIDPEVTDRVIAELTDHVDECDYASNVIERTFPRGLDSEAMFIDTLERIDRLARSAAAREHVTIVPRSERPELFLLRHVVDPSDNSDLRWTVDTADDLRLIRRLYDVLELDRRDVPYTRIVDYVRAQPELMLLNAGSRTWSPT
jgi:spore coat polysaccharide biosynthesis protein SpsF